MMNKAQAHRLLFMVLAGAALAFSPPAAQAETGKQLRDSRFQKLHQSRPGDSLRTARSRAAALRQHGRHAGDRRKLMALIRKFEALNERLERIKKAPPPLRRRKARQLSRRLAVLKRELRALRRDAARPRPARQGLKWAPALRQRGSGDTGHRAAREKELKRKRTERDRQTGDAAAEEAGQAARDAREKYRDALRLLQEHAERQTQVVQKLTS